MAQRSVSVVWVFEGEPDAIEEAIREWESEHGTLNDILCRGPNGDYTTPTGHELQVTVTVLRETLFPGNKP